MRCIFFSDLHIKEPGDKACNLFQKLCSHNKVKEATHVFLLGDIFDLLIGEHSEYFNKYDVFFESLIKLVDTKKVIFLEGNHDFHIKKSLTEFIEKKSSSPENFKYLREGELITLDSKKYYFCHGDEVDFSNESFKRWKRIYSSKEFGFFVNKILRFNFIDYLGKRVAKNSKSRGRKSFNYDLMKEKYLEGASRLIKEKAVSGIICGHTHIQENHEYQDGTVYLNCGHPLTHKNFLHFDGQLFSFVSLEDS